MTAFNSFRCSFLGLTYGNRAPLCSYGTRNTVIQYLNTSSTTTRRLC